jgi:hypothetical protein
MINDEDVVDFYGWGQVGDYVDDDPYAINPPPTYTQGYISEDPYAPPMPPDYSQMGGTPPLVDPLSQSLGAQWSEDVANDPMYTGDPALYLSSAHGGVVDLTSVVATIRWREDYWFTWTQPDDQAEALIEGQQKLDSILADLAQSGITFGQVGPVRAMEVTDFVTDDWEYAVDINIQSMSTNLTTEQLHSMATGVEQTYASEMGGPLTLQVAGDEIPAGAFAGTTGGGIGQHPYLLTAVILAGLMFSTTAVVTFGSTQISQVAEDVGREIVTPLTLIALLYLASKA